MNSEKNIVGWREWVSLPEFNIDRINAKVDTGARASSIHAHKVRKIDLEGDPHVEFFLYPKQESRRPEVYCCAPFVEKRIIRSSNGFEEERFVVSTTLALGTCQQTINLSLTNRDAMEYRLLIGRDALAGRFLVDPGASYLCGA